MRKSNIELLRIILIFLLIGWHVSVHENVLSWTFLAIAFPAAAVVPIFSIVSGYFLSKNSSYKYPLRFLITFVYIYLINLAVGSLVYGVTGDLSSGRLVWLITFGGRDAWYLWSLLIVYFLAPLVNRGLSILNKGYFMMMMVILTVLFFVFGYWIKFEYVSTGYATASGVILILYYYLLGAMIRFYLTDFLSNYRRWIYVLAPLVLFLQTGGLMLCYVTNQGILWRLINPSGGLVLVSSVLIFVLFLELKIKDSKFINYWASLSLVIYSFHYLFEYIIMRYKHDWSRVVDVNFLVNTLLIYTMTAVFAIPATFVFNKSTALTWSGLYRLNQRILIKRQQTEKKRSSNFED